MSVLPSRSGAFFARRDVVRCFSTALRASSRVRGRRLAGWVIAVCGLMLLQPWPHASVRPPRLDYTMTTLPNGLKVVMLEDHSTPIVHAEIWYHVGSKNEKKGRTGFAHLF
jgi:hypothetical protein